MDAPVSNPAHAALHARIRHLFTADPFSAPLAIRLIEVAPGWALLAMEVGRGQVNAHGGCHGGALWTLADMAFGAAGYYDGPILTVGSDLTFLRPAPAGSCSPCISTIPMRWWRQGASPDGGYGLQSKRANSKHPDPKRTPNPARDRTGRASGAPSNVPRSRS